MLKKNYLFKHLPEKLVFSQANAIIYIMVYDINYVSSANRLVDLKKLKMSCFFG